MIGEIDNFCRWSLPRPVMPRTFDRIGDEPEEHCWSHDPDEMNVAESEHSPTVFKLKPLFANDLSWLTRYRRRHFKPSTVPMIRPSRDSIAFLNSNRIIRVNSLNCAVFLRTVAPERQTVVFFPTLEPAA